MKEPSLLTSFPSSDHHQLPTAWTGQAYCVCGVSVYTGSLSLSPLPSSPYSQAVNRIIYSCCLFLIFLLLLNKTSACLQLGFCLQRAEYRNRPGSGDQCPHFHFSALNSLTHLNPLISVAPSSLSISLTCLSFCFLSFASFFYPGYPLRIKFLDPEHPSPRLE